MTPPGLDVLTLAAGRFGKIDMACPKCGPFCKSPVNRRRKVFRIWRHDFDFATYRCARCGVHGFTRNGITSPSIDPEKLRRCAEAERREVKHLKHKQRRAFQIWREAVPIAGTLAERYLVNRGIDVEALPNDMGEVLRWHPRTPWEQGHAQCLVALWTDIITGEPKAIHRRPINTKGEKVDRWKALGPSFDCVIRLWCDAMVTTGLVIGEGPETVLSAATRIERRGALLQPAWACGDAGHVSNFPILPGVEALTVLVDHDANQAGQSAASECAERWTAAGREVIRLTPQTADTDFNDIVTGEIAI